MPVFNLCGSGACVFQVLDGNNTPLDIEHSNWKYACPYPEVKDNVIESNGLRIHFITPGEEIHITYASKDGTTSFNIQQTAMCPLMPRGFVIPGEEVNTDKRIQPGGSEQAMHCTGTLYLNGREYKIDCYPARDRSWRQARIEDEIISPPFCWSPICFGKDLCFNQVGIEHQDIRYGGTSSKSIRVNHLTTLAGSLLMESRGI